MSTLQFVLTDLEICAPSLGDVRAVTALINACELADLGEALTTPEELRAHWQSPGACLETDAWLVAARQEDVAGYAMLFNPGVGRFYIDAYVHPAQRGRGIGTQLIRRAEARARRRVQEVPAGQPVKLTHNVHSANQSAHHVLEGEGFALARRLWQMQIDMPAMPPAPELPDGITLRIFAPGQDERATFEAMEEAFRDHWGYMPWRFDVWRQRGPGREDFEPSLWFLAMDGDQIAGGALCQSYPNEGWVHQLGVRRPWRRRGLGLALLRHAFGEFYRRGQPRVSLGVDSQNTTGATRLYERAGMRVAQQYDSFHKLLRPGEEQVHHEHCHAS
jgi:mycothiol synthase